MDVLFIIVLSLVLLFLGGRTLISNYRSPTAQTFFAFTALLVLWMISNYVSNVTSNYQLALWTNRLIFVFTTPALWYMYLFADNYPEANPRPNKWVRNVGLISTLLIAGLGLSSAIVKEIVIQEGHSDVIFGWGISLYVGHLLVTFTAFVVKLVIKYRRAIGLEKLRIQYFLFGMFVTVILLIITNLLLPLVFNIFGASNIGPAFLIILVAFTMYSIIRYRLFNIKFLVGNILILLLVSVIPFTVFYVQLALANRLFNGPGSDESFIMNVVISIAFSGLFVYLYRRVESFISRSVIHTEYDPQRARDSFSDQVSRKFTLDEVSKVIFDTIRSTLKPESQSLLIYKSLSKTSNYQIFHYPDNPKGQFRVDIILRYFKEISLDLVIRDELVIDVSNASTGTTIKKNVLHWMTTNNVTAIIPIQSEKRLNGIFFIGNRSIPYDASDINFLKAIFNSASIALERAIYFKGYEDSIAGLERKVKARTRQLRQNLEHIEELRRQERDMVDIMGHELRTPLSIAKLAFPRLMRFVNPKRAFKKRVPDYEKRISDAIKRESTLIETLLSATKLENSKIELSFGPVSPADVINNSVLAFKYQAEKKALQLVVKDQPSIDKLPAIKADATRVQEILDNLVSNAVKYTGKGTVTISAEKEGNSVRFSVSDTGIGIPKSAIANLGKKFFRVSQHINEDDGTNHGVSLVRPGGTGLGLFVAFGMIKAHKGELKIKSKEGKGSTFSFTIPVMSKQAVARAKAISQKAADLSSTPDLFERYGLNKK